MRKQVNPTLIGVFVVGAIVLAAAAVIVFGSGRFFTETYKWVAFFEDSVFGLNSGAPVIIRGIKVGSVTDIKLLGDPQKGTMLIEVFLQVEPGKVLVTGPRAKLDSRERLQRLIGLGLRAQLEMQSILTRQMMIVLDFHPDTPVKLLGFEPEYPEVPTIRSPMQELLEKVQKLPIQEIAESIRKALEGIQQVINSPEVADSLKALKGTLVATEDLVTHLNTQIGPLVANMDGTLTDARNLLQGVDARVDPVAQELQETLKQARLALVQAQGTLAALQAAANEDSPLVVELTDALSELTAASRSIRSLAETLDTQPESLLQGKRAPGGK